MLEPFNAGARTVNAAQHQGNADRITVGFMMLLMLIAAAVHACL